MTLQGSCVLARVEIEDDLAALVRQQGDTVTQFAAFHHLEPIKGSRKVRILIVTYSVDRWSLEEAHREGFGVVWWKHVAVQVQGSLKARLDDQRRIGRMRLAGERTPAELPDWYDLTHLSYVHGAELGLDPTLPTWQYLPGSGESKLNIGEALHLLQPR